MKHSAEILKYRPSPLKGFRCKPGHRSQEDLAWTMMSISRHILLESSPITSESAA